MSFDTALPDGWHWSTLDEVRAQGKSVVSGPFGSNIGSRFFVASGVPVIRGSNLTTGMDRFREDEFVFLTPEKAAEFTSCEAISDDLIFTAAGTIGQVGLIPKTCKYPKYIISNKQLRARLDVAKIDPEFAYYWFASPAMVKTIQSRNTGSTIPLINLTVLKSLPIPVPPLNEQREIAGHLAILDDRITLLCETNATLEAIAQTLFKSWFVDFDPVRAKMEGRTPEGMDEATAALFPDSFEPSELGEIPSGWRHKSLDEIATYLNGLALQKFPPTGIDDLPVIKIAQLRKGDTFGADRAARTIKPEYIIKNGDVLFSWSGSLEVEIWCGDEGALNQHLFKVTSVHYPKWFYFLWTRHHLAHFREVAASKATTMGHIQRTHLSQANVIVPTTQIFDAVESVFRPLISQLINNSLQAKSLANLRDTLLPRLISGQLRLPEAEKQVIEALA